MRKSKTLALAIAGVAALGSSACITASADTAPQPQAEVPVAGPMAVDAGSAVLAPGQCTGSWVRVTAQLTVRAKPDASSIAMFTVLNGEVRACRKLVLGTGYQACGVTNANGWILIQDVFQEYGHGLGWSGFIPSTCTVDNS